MDDFNISSLHESKNEWGARLLIILTPLIIEGIKSIFNESILLCKQNKETEKYLMTFQNLLSRIAVETQASPKLLNSGIYTPISTLLQVAGNPFGLHVNKQGLNPLGGFGGADTYLDVIEDKIRPEITNRLIQLTKDKINTGIDDVNIRSYGGGPDSILGIGKTYIRFATDNVGDPLKVSKATTDNTLDYFGISSI
jgi:hypothetical protein